MDFELNFAAKKLESEQDKRKEEAARRLKQQRAQRALQQREREERERVQREKRVAQEKAEEQERLEVEAKLELNHGIYFSKRFKLEVSFKAVEKGIARHKDKISLPKSTEHLLDPARKNGALCFEVATNSKRTHSMLLDFSAPEGKVEISPHVAGCLMENDVHAPEYATVSYSYLQEGTFARLQPLSANFQKNVIDLEGPLMQTLKGHSTLTEGEILEVEYEGVCYQVRVLELKPAPQVKVIDTDLEVEIAPSVEYEEKVAEEERAKRKVQEAAERLAAEQAEQERIEKEEERARALKAAQAADIERKAALDRLVAIAREHFEPLKSLDSVSSAEVSDLVEDFIVNDIPDDEQIQQNPTEFCELMLEIAATGQRVRRVFGGDFECAQLHTFVRASLVLHELKRLLSSGSEEKADEVNDNAMALICEGFQLVMGFGIASKTIPNDRCSLQSEGIGRREKIIVKALA